MTDKKHPGGVTIGNVSGGINNSVIAGMDVKNATISVGGQLTSVDKPPRIEELKRLLAEIQHELAEITAQQDSLNAVSSATTLVAQGAQKCVIEAAAKVKPELKPEEAKSVQKSLVDATSFLGSILDGAKSVLEKTGAVADAVKPLAEKIAPLVERVGVAALWAARLWPLG